MSANASVAALAASTRGQGRKPPATRATRLRTPPQKRKNTERVWWSPVAAVAVFSVSLVVFRRGPEAANRGTRAAPVRHWRLLEGSGPATVEESPPLDGSTALFTAGADDCDKTLSCSCLVSKRKNFVSRGADHSAALRGPFRLNPKEPNPCRVHQETPCLV